MPLQFAGLTVNRVIVHEVPQRRAGQAGNVVFSEIESPLTGPTGPRLKAFLQERLLEASASQFAVEVLFAAETDSPVPALVTQWLNGQLTDFVAVSKQIAQHLNDSQTGNSPSGLVTLVDCRVGQTPALAILKLEREIGVRAEQQQVNGHSTYTIEQVTNLILTQRTKVFKLGLFLVQGDQIRGVVCDQQRAYNDPFGVADFFLRKFLGCSLAEEAAVTTKRFFTAVETFINEQFTDAAERSTAMIHLISEVTNSTANLHPQQFVQNHFPPEKRQAALDYLKSKDFSLQGFTKDDTQLKPRLQKFVWEFACGVTIVASAEAQEHVTISHLDDGRARAVVVDRLRRVGTKR